MMKLINFLQNIFFKNKKDCNTVFIEEFHKKLAQNAQKSNAMAWDLSEIPEITDNDLINILDVYFNSPTLNEADDNLRNMIDNLTQNASCKQDNYGLHVTWFIEGIKRIVSLEEEWVKRHGKKHTDEEAAKIATEKVMELCFGSHIQDNGALFEEHSFMASALATSLADRVKSKVTDSVKTKAYELFYGFFIGYLKHVKTLEDGDFRHIDDYQNWLRTNIPSSNTEKYNWEHPDGQLYCDYSPGWVWSLILENAGMSDAQARLVCPWKTSISIRSLDNSVLYTTYQHCEYL